MTGRRSYPSYKETSIPWLATIPMGWEVLPLFSAASERKMKNIGMRESNLLSLSYGQIVKRDINSNEGLLPESFETYQIVDPNDIVFRMTDLQNDQRSLRSALVRERGIITSAYIAVRPKAINPSFLGYLMRAYDVQKVFYAMGGGLRQSLRFEDLRRLPLVIPSLSEQSAIVEFLDRETVRIDNLIAKKVRFIELLKEKLQAKIIASTSPRCDWDGIPFWRVARAKSISGMSDENLLSVYLDRGVIPYSEGGGLVHKPADSLEKYQLVEPGDLVMNNQQAWRGSLGVSSHRGIVSPAYLVFSLDKEKIDPSFANYAFRSRPYVEKFMLASMSVGDIQRQLKWPHLRKTRVSIPPLRDQKRIASEIDLESERMNALASKTERSIELLKEHRAALITAAVTGKIDVREAV